MPTLTPVEGNPFAQSGNQKTSLSGTKYNLTPVEGNPFTSDSQTTDDDMTWGRALTTGVKNIPSSAKKYVKDIVSAVKNYEKTGPALGRTFAGAVEKIAPGKQGDEQFFDALVGFYKDRYGSAKEFKKAIAQDPVGVLNDASMVLMGAGTTLKAVGMGGKLSEVGNVVSKAGELAEPIRAATYLPGKAVGPIANKMYRQSAKFAGIQPEFRMVDGKVRRIPRITKEKELAEFGMEKGLMPTEAGVSKILDQQDVLIDRLNNAIAAKDTGQTIKVADLFEGLDDLREEWATFAGGEAMKGVKQIDRAQEGTKKGLSLAGKKELTIREAEKLKKKIYQINKTAYGQTKAGTAFEGAQKVIARNAKEFIESVVPEVKGINKSWAEYQDFIDSLDRAAQRIGHREPLANLGFVTKVGAGGVIAGPAGSAIGASLGVLDYPTVQAKLAILLKRMKKAGIKVSPAMVTARILAAKANQLPNNSNQPK